jgi:hypothetical protein
MYIEKLKNNFFKKNVRAKISSMKYPLVSVYQVCSNINPGIKIDPAPGVLLFHKHFKNLLVNDPKS